MSPHRFHLPTLQLKRLQQLERRELDDLTRRRVRRQERELANTHEARSRVREALGYSPLDRLR